MLTKVNKNNKNVNKSVDKLVIMIYIGIVLIKVNTFKQMLITQRGGKNIWLGND